jgi:alpha-galactosidase
VKISTIVIIGAGSATFTRGLILDLIESGQPWALGLVDIDPQALEIATKLAQRLVDVAGADIKIRAATDRRDVLPNADVVVTTISVGGRRAWETDVHIPRKYGIFQPVGDTVMVGGISRAARMVPPMIEIAEDVLKLCPQAYFFNYSNPMSVICWAVRRTVGTNIVGLCHGSFQVHRDLAKLIAAPLGETTTLAAGLNHFTWIYDFRWKGEDAWPLVRERLASLRGQGSPQDIGKLNQDVRATEQGAGNSYVWRNPFSWSLFETYDAYPVANDRHVVEFFPERFPGGKYYGKTLGVNAFSLEAVIAAGDEQYARMRAEAYGEIPLDAQGLNNRVGEHEQLLDMVHSIEQDNRRCYTANLPNDGVVSSLPDEAVLELTVAATGRGLRPLHVGDLPSPLAALQLRKIAAQALTVEAALCGSKRLFIEALLADGSVSERETAEKLTDELLRAHQRYLPQFG